MILYADVDSENQNEGVSDKEEEEYEPFLTVLLVEVKAEVDSMKNNRASGDDRIVAEHLKVGSKVINEILAEIYMYNTIITRIIFQNHGHVPT